MRYGHSQCGLTGITLNDKAMALLAHNLHSCSQLVRNLTRMRNELSKDSTHHLEESNARIQADNSDRMKLWERQYQCIDRFDPSGHYATIFIIVSGKLTAASVNVKDALHIDNSCMAAYENKLFQGFYNKISSYVVTMDTPMKGINLGAITTVDTEVVFNRTLGIIGSEEFGLHDLFSHELAPIQASLFLDDGSMISASSN